MNNGIIGRTIKAIYIAKDKEALRFDIEGGPPLVVVADGDCCSRSWVESLDMPELILGSPVVAVEDIEMPDLGDLPGCDVVSYYGCKITTGKGSCVIDYRNDSNGYYGGSLAWPHEYPCHECDEHGLSTDGWEPIATL